MQAAIIQGLYNDPLSSADGIIGWTCETGNCTFPTFSSLAMCHTCIDISDTIIYNETYSCLFRYDTTSEAVIWNQSAAKLPSGASITQNQRASTWANLTWREQDPPEPSELLYFEILMSWNRSLDKESCSAYDCTVSPCFKTYEANVTNSTYYE